MGDRLRTFTESLEAARSAYTVGGLRAVLRDIFERALGANSVCAVESIRQIAETAASVSDGYMFEVGDLVAKRRGYRWPGVVVMVGRTLAGEERVVVECTVEGVEGALHIYSPQQLERTNGVQDA